MCYNFWHMKRAPLITLLAINLIYSCAPLRGGPSHYPYPSTGGYQVGIASWYGDKEHGRKTASGERFNKYAHTAAHRTLPMGTIVRVVNLENGRDTLVKINDRGPFVSGRIIDLSYASAKDLGMIEKGTAMVKLEVISIPTHSGSAFTPRFTVQVGSFKEKTNAMVLKRKVGKLLSDDVRVELFEHRGDLFYRVRVGHYEERSEAERAAYKLRSWGYRGKVVQE